MLNEIFNLKFFRGSQKNKRLVVGELGALQRKSIPDSVTLVKAMFDKTCCASSNCKKRCKQSIICNYKEAHLARSWWGFSERTSHLRVNGARPNEFAINKSFNCCDHVVLVVVYIHHNDFVVQNNSVCGSSNCKKARKQSTICSPEKFPSLR